MRNRKVIPFIAASILALGLAWAQADPHHPDPGQTPAPPSTPSSQMLPAVQAPGGMNNPASPGMSQGMNMMQGATSQQGVGMMGQSLMMLEGAPFEQAFLSMMIPHHRTAIDMARKVLARTQDPQIRGWANAIIRDQEREIAQMKGLLGVLGGTNLAAQRMMTQTMANMMQTPGPGNMTQSQGASGMMQTPRTPASPERDFLQAMVSHHLQAVEMATMALQKAQNPVIVKLASDIVRAQVQEVYEMRVKLASLR